MNQFNEDLIKMLNSSKSNIAVEKELWDFTEMMMNDLEISRNHNICLEKQLKDMTLGEIPSTKQYIALEEKIIELEQENATLKAEIKEYGIKRLEAENDYEEKLVNVRDELKRLNEKLIQKDKDFFDELQMAQAASAYEFEKIEQKLKWELTEANKKLHEYSDINLKLRNQLQNVENQKYCSEEMLVPTKQTTLNRSRVVEFPDDNKSGDIETCSVQERIAEDPKKYPENSFSNTCSLRTYEPLQVECTALHSKVSPRFNSGKQTPPLFKGKKYTLKKVTGHKLSKNFNLASVPPLNPCSDSGSNLHRKRRLHDPDDLSYLVNLMPSEND